MKTELKGKFVIAYDTICNGEQCMMDGEAETPEYKPMLFDSEDEAFIETFDSNHSMLVSHMEDGQLEELNEGVTPEMIEEMGILLEEGNVSKMKDFMNKHPQCNDTGEFVEKADEFILGRKLVLGEQGFCIEGKLLSEL